MISRWSILVLVAIAILGDWDAKHFRLQAADEGTSEAKQIEVLKARLKIVEAELNRLKAIVASLPPVATTSQADLEESDVIGQWEEASQSMVLSFKPNGKFEIRGSVSTGTIRGAGTWRLDRQSRVIATYNYDGNPEWATTSLPLISKSRDSLEFAGVEYLRRTGVDVSKE